MLFSVAPRSRRPFFPAAPASSRAFARTTVRVVPARACAPHFRVFRRFTSPLRSPFPPFLAAAPAGSRAFARPTVRGVPARACAPRSRVCRAFQSFLPICAADTCKFLVVPVPPCRSCSPCNARPLYTRRRARTGPPVLDTTTTTSSVTVHY